MGIEVQTGFVLSVFYRKVLRNGPIMLAYFLAFHSKYKLVLILHCLWLCCRVFRSLSRGTPLGAFTRGAHYAFWGRLLKNIRLPTQLLIPVEKVNKEHMWSVCTVFSLNRKELRECIFQAVTGEIYRL